MSPTRKKSIAVSLFTAGLELLALKACTVALMGPILLVMRWLVGAVGASLNYLLNRRWAFRARHESSTTQGARYAIIAVSGVTLGTITWWFALKMTTLSSPGAHVLSMVAVWLLFSYPMFKHWVFRTEESLEITYKRGSIRRR